MENNSEAKQMIEIILVTIIIISLLIIYLMALGSVLKELKEGFDISMFAAFLMLIIFGCFISLCIISEVRL